MIADGGDDQDWVMALECSLVSACGWSLNDIDDTDIESLIPFAFEYPKWMSERSSGEGRRKVYADQASFL